MSTPLWAWSALVVGAVVLLTLDLFIFHRRAHRVGTKEAGLYSAFYVGLGLAAMPVLWLWRGSEDATNYITGFIIEKSLSLDNLFVFAVIFNAFAVPPRFQHRVLFWGILGAIAFRAAFIFAGSTLLNRFGFMAYLLGAFLVATGARLAIKGDVEIDPESNPVVRGVRRLVPVESTPEKPRFLGRVDGRLAVTSLFLALVAIETSDLLFAVDSVPAILAITTDTFIVFSANLFAILGLRALYFLVAAGLRRLEHLDVGMALVLVFAGAKLMLEHVISWPFWVSLLVIAALLSASVVASLLIGEDEGNAPTEAGGVSGTAATRRRRRRRGRGPAAAEPPRDSGAGPQSDDSSTR